MDEIQTNACCTICLLNLLAIRCLKFEFDHSLNFRTGAVGLCSVQLMESGWRSGLYPWIRWGILVFFSPWVRLDILVFLWILFYRFSCPFQVLTEPSFMPAVVVPGFDKNSLKDAPVKFSPGSAYQGEFVRDPPFFYSIPLICLKTRRVWQYSTGERGPQHCKMELML